MFEGLYFLDFVAMALLVLLTVTALGVVATRNLFAAVMLLGIFSLLMASVFFILDAADVALTEAAVGAGVSTVLLLGTLALTTDKEKRSGFGYRDVRFLIPFCVVLVTMAAMLFATSDMPHMGDPAAPAHNHVSPRYLEDGPKEVAVPNLVTAVLGSYRGFDTFGEVVVVFTAGIGVLMLLGTGRRSSRYGTQIREEEFEGLKSHIIPRVVSKLLIPFIMLLALYIQFHGDYSPGGGFQAGAIFTAAIMLYALVNGEEQSRRVMPERVMLVAMVAGVLLYLGIGVVSMLRGANFLDYNVLLDDPLAGQHYGIVGIEFGVGLTVTAVLVSIFHAFAGRERR